MTSICGATAKADCRDVIRAADRALDAKKKEISLCQLGLMQALEDNRLLKAEVQDMKESEGSVWRNPFFLIAVGAIGGIIIAK